MNRRIKRSLVWAVLAVLSLFSGAASAAADCGELADGVRTYVAEASGAETLQEWTDTYLADRAGQGAEWFVFALAQSGESIDYTEYFLSLKNFTESKSSVSAVESLRIALAMVSVGARDDSFVLETVENCVGKQGIMSLVFGLHLVCNGAESESVAAETIVSDILSLQGEDGGWSLDGKASDVDITGMVLQALAHCREYEGVENSADRAFEFLKGKMLPNGDFVSYGVPNAESSAQVILALTSWGRDPADEADFSADGRDLTDVLEKYRLPDGSFSHTEGGKTSQIATAQSLCALISVERLREGKTAFFRMDSETVDYGDGKAESFSPGYKFWVCFAVGVLAVAGCTLILVRKRSKKNIAVILLAGAVCVAAVLLTDIRTEKDYFSSERQKGERIGTVGFEIRCDSIAGSASGIPEDGCLVPRTEQELYSGDSVYDILTDVLKSEGLIFESQNKNYVTAISNIGERQYGDLSGWVYYVNGERPSMGCGDYVLSDGDEVLLAYSLEMGKDIEIEGN